MLQQYSLTLLFLIVAISGATVSASSLPTAETSSLMDSSSGGKMPGKTLRVCSFELAPYYSQIDGEFQGILIDIIDSISSTLGVTPHYEMTPPLRCARLVKQGSYDLMPFTSGHIDNMLYTQVSVHFYIAGFIVNNTSDKQHYLGPEQFNHQRVGILRGNPQQEELAHYSDIEWVKVNSGNSQWRMLLSDRLDAAYGDLIALTALTPYRNGLVRFLLPAYSVSAMRMGFNISKTEWRNAFDEELNRMLMDGRISSIYLKHSQLSFEDIRVLIDASNAHQVPTP